MKCYKLIHFPPSPCKISWLDANVRRQNARSFMLLHNYAEHPPQYSWTSHILSNLQRDWSVGEKESLGRDVTSEDADLSSQGRNLDGLVQLFTKIKGDTVCLTLLEVQPVDGRDLQEREFALMWTEYNRNKKPRTEWGQSLLGLGSASVTFVPPVLWPRMCWESPEILY